MARSSLAFRNLLTPIRNEFLTHSPEPKQAAFLLLDNLEALYGGAAGAGKSAVLLMGALQYVHVPRYSAIIFRKTYTALTEQGALIPMSHEWLGGTSARWSERKLRWTFPSGAVLAFGSLEHERDKFKYQGAAYQYLAFDELTQFPESVYTYLLSRARRDEGHDVPVRVRSATNPGGDGHVWVKRRFIDEGRKSGRIFIPAKLEDNPYLDTEEYERAMAELDPVTRGQLRHGDWSIQETGGLFKADWFGDPIDRDEIPEDASWCRYWDLASTKPKAGYRDPDYTAGALVAKYDGVWYIVEITRLRGTPGDVEETIKRCALRDGTEVPIFIEQERGGASGAVAVHHYQRHVLSGYAVKGVLVTGRKHDRWRPVSSASEAGLVKLCRGFWIGEFLSEAVSVPYGHDDQVDAVAGAFAQLVNVRDSTDRGISFA